jgi:hypothetical protein
MVLNIKTIANELESPAPKAIDKVRALVFSGKGKMKNNIKPKTNWMAPTGRR